LAGFRFDAAVTGERSAIPAAKLISQFGQHIDNDVVMNVPRARHHSYGKAVNQLVALGLPFLPGKEFFDGPSPWGGIGHGSHSSVYPIDTTPAEQ
jgi:hypothetical protein